VKVRLDEERLGKARVLREHGLALSDVIREAIDERFDQLDRSGKVRDVRAIIQRIFEQYPDPPASRPEAMTYMIGKPFVTL
jgi:hypothetical protein